MKKFITLMAAAAMTLSASAEVIYSWQSEGPDAVQQVGGIATAKVDEARVNYANKSGDITYYTICLCGKKQTYPESAYVNVTLDKPLAEGDVISVTAYRNKNESGKNVTVEFIFDANKDNTIASTVQFANINPDGENDPAPSTQNFTVPASAAGCTFFDMTRGSASTNLFITKLEITREGGEEPSAPTFKWEPTGMNPYTAADIISLGALETVGFQVYGVDGIAITDVMPVWVDEDGNEIKALSGVQDPWGWNPNEFNYKFDTSAFKANGEYELVFPEGMLVNAAGEKSEKIQTPYSFGIPELAPAMFDDFKILSIDPDLTQPQAIWNDQMMKINTNHNDAIGLTKLTITDTTTGDIVCTSSSFSVGRQLGDDAEISWEVTGPYKFFEGHTYRADIVFYNGTDEQDYDTGLPTKVVDRVSYSFEGRVEAYKYSAVTLESVTPAPGTYMISDPSQAVFTYTFSGPVTVYQAYTPMGMNGQYDYPASCLSSNEEKTEWILDLSGNDFIKSLDSALPISIRARDLDGNQLQGNFGEEALSGFEYEWECELGAPAIEIVVPAYDTAVEKLTEVIVKSVDGNPIAYQGYPAATIQSRNRQMLGELYLNPDAEASAEVRFTQWIPEGAWEPVDLDLSAEGIYSIVFPHGAFMFGEQFESKQSHSAGTSFEITGEKTPDEPGVDPAEQEVFNYDKAAPEVGTTVTSLSKVQLWFPEMVNCEEFTANVYNVTDQSLVTTGYGMFDWDDVLLINIDLAQPVVEAGQYEVVIPARVIGDEAFFNTSGASGICNPEIKLLYTVDPDGSAVITVEGADADAVYYDLAGRRVMNPTKGIYIVNGKKVVK